MSFENDITNIRKLLKEGWKSGTETETPVITPETPTKPMPTTTPSPTKPSTPIRPKPGVTPKPKAFSPDVDLFLKRRRMAVPGAVKEAGEELLHRDKSEWMDAGDEQINQLLPDLSPEQQRYLKTITSESYAETVARIEEYTGLTVTRRNVPSLIGILVSSLEAAMSIERGSKERLEDLAMELVFSLPEFKIAEEAYLKDEMRIDAKIDSAQLQNLQPPEAPEDGLTEDEELNMEMADLLAGSDVNDIRRKFANLMITGGSINKLYLFNLVKEKLNAINPELAKYYGILASVAQLGYWVMPFGVEEMAAGGEQTSAGSEEVIPEGDIYVIKARGTTFPYLVHELVKGIYEWLSIDPDLETSYAKDKVGDETKDVMAGPGIYKTVVSYVPADKQELIPIVQKKLVAMGPAEIRDVLAKNSNGQKIMAGILQAAEQEWEGYKKSKEEYEES